MRIKALCFRTAISTCLPRHCTTGKPVREGEHHDIGKLATVRL